MSNIVKWGARFMLAWCLITGVDIVLSQTTVESKAFWSILYGALITLNWWSQEEAS